MDDGLRDALGRSLRRAQAQGRAPGVAALVARGGEPLWEDAVGLADVAGGTPQGTAVQHPIGSITKTFTAGAVLQLRDAGALSLDDTLADHLPDAAHGRLRLRDLLSHGSGLQREVPGDAWDTLVMPGRDELLGSLAGAEAVLPPRTAWHYSNLAFALLGEIVARRAGAPFEHVAQERLLDPLGLRRTTFAPQEPYARGYLVHPYVDVAEPEPEMQHGATAPAGALCSTVRDLARWGACLAGADPEVLSPAAVEAMHTLHVMHDTRRWTLAWGLGLALYRRGERLFSGHEGAVPGFRAGLVVQREERLSAAVVANSSAGIAPDGVALELLQLVLEARPSVPPPFTPGPPPPVALASATGRWWSEGMEFVFRVHQGRLEARRADLPADTPWSVFEPEGADLYRTVAGRERGELLRVERDASGAVTRLYWASYPFERSARTFGPSA